MLKSDYIRIEIDNTIFKRMFIGTLKSDYIRIEIYQHQQWPDSLVLLKSDYIRIEMDLFGIMLHHSFMVKIRLY